MAWLSVPLGAASRDGGVNFAAASEVADGVELCLFDDAGAQTRLPLQEYDAGVWHGFVPGTGLGQRYGFRTTGPYDPSRGLRCNPAKLLGHRDLRERVLARNRSADWGIPGCQHLPPVPTLSGHVDRSRSAQPGTGAHRRR